MKSSDLSGFLIFAAITMSIALVDNVQISSELTINRLQAWEYGFAQIGLVFGVALALSAYGTYKGMLIAKYVLLAWAAVYSVAVVSLVQWHFNAYLVESLVVGIAFSTLWFFLVRSRASASST